VLMGHVALREWVLADGLSLTSSDVAHGVRSQSSPQRLGDYQNELEG
jgi:hypothetical protein